MNKLYAVIFIMGLAAPVWAVQPSEVLSDPGLEARARAISQTLRCPVCQGENIDESNAPISHDLRMFVRERLTQGDTDAQVIDAVTARFGEYVLFEPAARGVNWLLYLAGPLMAVVAAVVLWRILRRRPDPLAPDRTTAALTPEEEAELARILKEKR